MEALDLLEDTAPDRPVVWDILEAWDASFADGRLYKVSSAGLEAALDDGSSTTLIASTSTTCP